MREQVLRFMGSPSYRPMKLHALAKGLKVPKDRYSDFRSEIKLLERDGLIVLLKGNRYAPPGKLNLIVGRLNLNPAGFGFVCRDAGADIYVEAGDTSTALHGDKVVVRLSGRRGPKGALEGQVIRVLDRAIRSVVGTYKRDKHFGYVKPDDARIIRAVYIPDDHAKGALEGQKVVAVIEEWPSEQLNPEGRITEVLGSPDAPGMDVLAIIREYGLPLVFPPAVESAAREIARAVGPEDMEGRLDLRECPCVTIDPDDARDFDDAVSLEDGTDGRLILGVHIADVSHYVAEGSVLDQEARTRGTSVYLVDRVIPMLPTVLSGDMCSLRQGEDRLAISVLVDITETGEVISCRMAESVIRSKARLTYAEAQAFLDGSAGDGDGEVGDMVRRMERLRRTLTDRRRRRGAIDFDLPEARVTLDSQGCPVDAGRYPRLDSNRLIEELMLLANELVSSHLESVGAPILYRVHDRPDPVKLLRFTELLQSLGHSVRSREMSSPMEIQRLLARVAGSPEEGLVNELLLRSMKRAVYSPVNIGHFGLACRSYTHFTSPIRRYPDLLTHRTLRRHLRGGIDQEERNLLSSSLPRLGEMVSERERIAQDAERDSVQVKQVQFLKGHVGEDFYGIISGVQSFGFFVALEETLIEGLVKVTWLDDDFYIYDDRRCSLTGRRTRRMFKMGDRILVRVARADIVSRQVDFHLVASDGTSRGPRSSRKPAAAAAPVPGSVTQPPAPGKARSGRTVQAENKQAAAGTPTVKNVKRAKTARKPAGGSGRGKAMRGKR